LTAEQIRKEIYLDYHYLIEARFLDGVLIVAPLALNTDGEAFVRTATGFAFKTPVNFRTGESVSFSAPHFIRHRS